jgi:hypothetical protein
MAVALATNGPPLWPPRRPGHRDHSDHIAEVPRRYRAIAVRYSWYWRCAGKLADTLGPGSLLGKCVARGGGGPGGGVPAGTDAHLVRRLELRWLVGCGETWGENLGETSGGVSLEAP